MQQKAKGAFHHLGVQTADLDNSLRWYLDFFEAEQRWELDRFSELTLSRLPGISRLVEVAVGDLRFHLFDYGDGEAMAAVGRGYVQHACIELDSPDALDRARARWIDLHASGRYTFARPDGPTEVVADDDGVLSLYVYDVNGMEYEFTYVPENRR
jgi:hypothetical protein